MYRVYAFLCDSWLHVFRLPQPRSHIYYTCCWAPNSHDIIQINNYVALFNTTSVRIDAINVAESSFAQAQAQEHTRAVSVEASLAGSQTSVITSLAAMQNTVGLLQPQVSMKNERGREEERARQKVVVGHQGTLDSILRCVLSYLPCQCPSLSLVYPPLPSTSPFHQDQQRIYLHQQYQCPPHLAYWQP